MAKGAIHIFQASPPYTEYLDPFTTDPMTSRVTARTGGTWTHDSANGKLQCVADTGGNGRFAAQSDAPMCSTLGRIEVQAEITITADTAGRKHAGFFIETQGTGGTGFRIAGLDGNMGVSGFQNGGSEVSLASVSFGGFTQGTTYTLKTIIDFFVGRIFVYVNGALIVATSFGTSYPNTFTAGRPGYCAYGNTVKWDNLSYKYIA